jgi:hypothetical protein
VIAGTAIDSLDSTASLANSIVWNDDLGEDVTATYSDIEGGLAGSGNIDMDPMFVDEAGGDLRLAAASPCIDAADNTAVPPDTADVDGDEDTQEGLPFDLNGNPRFVDDPETTDTGKGTAPIVDMGPYEFQGTSCPWDCQTTPDGNVNIPDFLKMLTQWGGPGSCDFDGGGVGITDFLDLLAFWGPCP